MEQTLREPNTRCQNRKRAVTLLCFWRPGILRSKLRRNDPLRNEEFGNNWAHNFETFVCGQTFQVLVLMP
jgi:hypothetical protein